jgi:D-sedoheptulose 7-phosphate isomerase
MQVKQLIQNSINTKSLLLENNDIIDTINKCVDAITNAFHKGNKVLFCGNGGSAADAQHLAAEFVSKLARDRSALPAEALTTDSSVLTAIGNDYGFENIFSRQLAAKLQNNDVFLAITTSGNSENIISALRQCRSSGVKSIVFSGRGGGRAVAETDCCIIAPGERTSVIQEVQILLAHSLCECVETSLFP